jgi:mannan endo-1,4-beta-mannosidase
MSANIMKITLKTVVWALLALAAISCSKAPQFVTVKDGHFQRDGKPYSYVGTNFWYGPILASEGRGGDIERLQRELDTLKALGLTNLRTLVGGDGPDGVFSRVEPTLQTAPGVYNDTLLTGLDRYLVELGKRGMQTVLYINNSWEWSGGYGQYLEWATGEKTLIPLVDGYWPFMQQMRKFQTSAPAQELYFNHLRNIVGRTNSITGKPYKDDPAIFAWQLGNEPRCFSSEKDIQDGFIGWMTKAAAIVKELDPNHLLSTGNEGLMGSEEDIELLKRLNSIPGIDYMTIHIWPYNWGWAKADSLEEDLPAAIEKTSAYIGLHRELANELGLPVVCEEFGFPRDGFKADMNASTRARDAYYKFVFSQVGGNLDGANFWGWSGFAVPSNEQWVSGDPYTGDPAQEAQGLNGVYVTDSTVDIICNATNNLNQ